MKSYKGVWVCLLMAASGLLIGVAALTWLSQEFIWGEGHETRPIRLMVAVLLGCWASYGLGAWAVARLSGRHHSERPPCLAPRIDSNQNRDHTVRDNKVLAIVIGVGLLARLLVLPSHPIQESDFYRYLWDGQMAAAGLNPYAHAPAQMTPEDLVDDPSELAAAAVVHQRINYPEVKTIYPIGAQTVFWVTAQVFGWNIYGFRVIFLLVDLLLLLVLWRILAVRAEWQGWILLYAWCPLVIKEYLNSMHLDIVCALLLGCFVLAIQRERWWWGWAALMAAGLVKLTPWLLIPLWMAAVYHRLGRRQAMCGGMASLVVIGTAVGVMFIGAVDPFDGLVAFGREWENNGSLYPLVKGAVIALGATAEHAALLAKALLGGALVAGVAWGMRSMKTAERLLRGCLWTLFWLYLISPVGNPWYLGWLLPFMVVLRHWPTVVLMACSALYYLVFYFIYHQSPDTLYLWLKLVEYSPVCIVLGICAWRHDDRGREIPLS